MAFAATKFFVVVRPINGRSVAFGTRGFVVARARRSNESLAGAPRERKASSPAFPRDGRRRVERASFRADFRAAFGRGWNEVSHRARGRVSRATRRTKPATKTALGEEDENRARFARSTRSSSDARKTPTSPKAVRPVLEHRVVFRRGTEPVWGAESMPTRDTLGW